MYVRKSQGKNLPIPEIQQYDFSGFNLSRSDTTEVTLTGAPAVENAMFRVIRSTPEDVEKAKAPASSQPDKATLDTLYSLHQIPLVHEDSRMQVFGYVLVPWIEDYYGDIFDPRGVESACHSFMKSVALGVADGPGGIGENHWRWMANAYPVQSVIDYSGNIGGIPGGWWLGLQIQNPETWELVKNGTYTGYSVGCYVNGSNYNREKDAKKAIWDKVTLSFSKKVSSQPGEKHTRYQFPGLFGFPKEDESYADPVNRMFPIDTGGRALAVAHYLLDMGKSASYTDEEVRFMVGRALKSAHEKGAAIPDLVVDRMGLPKHQASKSIPEPAEGTEVSPTSEARKAEEKEEGFVTKVVEACMSRLKSVFDKDGNKKSEEVVIDMDKKELLEFLASDDAKTALLGGLNESIATLSKQVEAVAGVVTASAGITVAKATETDDGKTSKDAPVETPALETSTETTTTTTQTATAAPVAPVFDPLSFITALEKHSAAMTENVTQAVLKAINTTKEEEAAKGEPKRLSNEERLASLADSIDKLDRAMAERASTLGALTLESESLRKAKEAEAFRQANPFEGSGSVFSVTQRSAIPAGESNTMPVAEDAKVVARTAAIKSPLPSAKINPDSHPAFSA